MPSSRAKRVAMKLASVKLPDAIRKNRATEGASDTVAEDAALFKGAREVPSPWVAANATVVGRAVRSKAVPRVAKVAACAELTGEESCAPHLAARKAPSVKASVPRTRHASVALPTALATRVPKAFVAVIEERQKRSLEWLTSSRSHELLVLYLAPRMVTNPRFTQKGHASQAKTLSVVGSCMSSILIPR